MSFVSNKYNYYRFLITKVKGTGSSSPIVNTIAIRDTSNNSITNISISGSSTNDVANTDVDKLSDGSDSTYWTCISGRYTNGIPNTSASVTYTNIRRNISGEWFQIYSSTDFELKDITITSSTNATSSQPDNITVLSSISGDIWYIYHIFTNISYTANVSINSIYAINTYSYYRFIGARLKGARAALQFNELQLIGSEPNVTNNQKYPPINLSGGQAPSFNIPSYTISGQLYGNGVYNLAASSVGYNLFPTNALDGSILAYSSIENTVSSYNNLSDSIGGAWPVGGTVTTVSQTSISGQWFQIQVPVAIVLNRLNYYFQDSIGYPESLVIAGSNNGTAWDLVRFFNGIPFTSTNMVFNSLQLIRSIPTNVPNKPTNISASFTIPNILRVSFTQPLYTGDADILYYNVKSNPGSITVSGLSSPITISGLSNTTTYTFTVTAVNVLGESLDSDNTNKMLYNNSSLQNPTNISISGGIQKCNIHFTSVSGATYYKVLYGISGQFDLSRSLLSRGEEISGLEVSKHYNFKIFSANNSSVFDNDVLTYSTEYATKYYTYSYPPQQVQTPAFTVSSFNRSVLVTITPVPTANAYKIYYGISGQDLSNSITFNGISGYIKSLIPNISYQFRVSSLYTSEPVWVYATRESPQSTSQYSYSLSTQNVDNFSIIRTGINNVTGMDFYQTTRIKYINSNTRVVSGYSFQDMGVYDSSGILKFTINGGGSSSFGYNIIYENGIPITTMLYNGGSARNEYSSDITLTEKHIYTIGDCAQDLSLSTLSVSGATIRSTNYTTNPNDAFITKYDLCGNLNWITRIGGSAIESGKCITSFANNIYVGTTIPPNSTTNIYDTSNNILFSISGDATQTSSLITCYTDTGIPKWRAYSKTGPGTPTSITTDGVYIYVVGTCNNSTIFFSSNDISYNYNMTAANGFIMCMNTNGIIQWLTKITGGTLLPTSITVYNNNLYIGGKTDNSTIALFNATNSSQFIMPYTLATYGNGMLIKYTISGAPLWMIQTKGPATRCIISDVVANGNGVYFTSQYQDTIDIFDSSANNITTHITISGDNTAIIKVDNNGKYLYSHTSYSKRVSTATYPGGLDVYNNLVTYSVYSVSGAIYDTYDISQGSLEAYSQYIIQNRDISATFTIPSTPTLQIVASTSSSVDLSWTSIPNITTYKLYYGVSGYTNVLNISNVQPYTLSLPIPNAAYNITITAVNDYGESHESNVLITEILIAPSVTLLVTPNILSTNIYFTNVSGATTYTLYYGTISGSLTSTVTGTISGQLITGLVGGRMFFRIAAFNGASFITQSDQVQAIIRPGPPTISSAIGGIKKATLTVSRAYGATQHFVKYKKSGTANFTTIQIE